jgi:hypothetical protein
MTAGRGLGDSLGVIRSWRKRTGGEPWWSGGGIKLSPGKTTIVFCPPDFTFRFSAPVTALLNPASSLALPGSVRL